MQRLFACLLSAALLMGAIVSPLPDQRVSAAVVQSETQLPPPVVVQVTASTVTLQGTEGYEYSKDGLTWWSSHVFQGLTAGQEYALRQRVQGQPATQSDATKVTTKQKSPCSLPVLPPQVDYCTADTVWLVPQKGCEYRINGGKWQTIEAFYNLTPDTAYTFEQRWVETAEELASPASEPLVVRTRGTGSSSLTNHALVAAYVEANGETDEEQNKSLGYLLEDELEGGYYFFLTNKQDYLTMELFYDGSVSTGLFFYYAMDLYPQKHSVYVKSETLLFYEGEAVDYVDASQYFNKAAFGEDFTFTTNQHGLYLTAEDVSMLGDLALTMLFGFWDETLYNQLGFGMKGLGFTTYPGYGEAFCDPATGYHAGQTEILYQRDAGCETAGSLGYEYCTTCCQKISHLGEIAPTGSHTYDHDCDPDCNTCGTVRRTQHRYSFACSKACSVCGALREEVFATHTLNENLLCTLCGEQGRYPGDVTGDGKVNMGDVAKVYAHIRSTNPITDPLELAVADVTGDGRINMGDVAKVYAHIRGTNPITDP